MRLTCLIAVQAERRDQVPGDRLAFAVGVSREQDGGLAARVLLQPLDDVLALLGDDVLRPEVVFDVDAELAGGQVADVAQAGAHRVVAPQELFDRFGLGGRFDHHRLGSHVS